LVGGKSASTPQSISSVENQEKKETHV